MPLKLSETFETLLPNAGTLHVVHEKPCVVQEIAEKFARPLRLFVPLMHSALLLDALVHADGNKIREVVAVKQKKKPDIESRLKDSDCMKTLLSDPLCELSERELAERESRLRIIEITPYHIGDMLQNKIFELNQLVEHYGNDAWDNMPHPGSVVAEAGATEFSKLEPTSNVLLPVAVRTASKPNPQAELTALRAFHDLSSKGAQGNRTWLGPQLDRPR